MFCDITYGSRVARRNQGRGRIQEPFLTRRERSSLGGIKSNQNHAALTLPISKDSTPTHPGPSSIVGQFPSPPSFSFSLLFLPTRRTGRSLTVVQFSASASLSRSVRMCRDKELVQRTRIRFTERGERKKYELARTPERSAEILIRGFSLRIAF